MTEKMITPEKEPTQLDISFIPEKSSTGEDVEETKSKPHRRSKIRRAVKLPRLKLEDLVSQVIEENAHREISTGQAVGNEV